MMDFMRPGRHPLETVRRLQRSVLHYERTISPNQIKTTKRGQALGLIEDKKVQDMKIIPNAAMGGKAKMRPRVLGVQHG